MYDARNERKEFIAGDRAEAIAKACDFFGVGEDALEIGEFDPGAVYGLSSRTVVVAALIDRTPPAPGGGDRDRGPGGRDRDERGGRDRGGRDRGGRERGGRDRGGRGRDRGGQRGGRGERSERDDRRPVEARSEEPSAPLAAPSEPSVGTVEGELGEVGRFVLGALERMDLGPFQIQESEEDGLLAFELSGPAPLQLASSDGRAVDALQLLANQVASRLSEDPPRVVLDVGGESEQREERLEAFARRAAKRALETGRTVRLDPMNGHDRRLIHLALRDEDGVATMSSGEGRYRQVLVVPEEAPEYEEALRESQAASQRTA